MIVGSIDETGQFVPMLEMLENLYRLVTITKATASNKGFSLDGAGKTRSRAACGLGYPLRW